MSDERINITDRVFYDSQCGFCHRWVRWVVRAERGRELFRYAPLHGVTFTAHIPEPVRRTLPPGVVVLTHEGQCLTRSSAALHVLARLGGWRAVLARMALRVPRPVRDGVYAVVAKSRRWLARSPANECPVPTEAFRRRLDP